MMRAATPMRYLVAIVAGFLVSALSAGASAGPEQDVDRMGSQVADLATQVSSLPGQYLGKNAALHSATYVEERVAEAEAFYRMKDYGRASIIYLEITESYPQHPAYPDALFHLADSLFHTRDYYGARGFFTKVLDHSQENGYRSYIQPSLARLIEIGIATRSFEGIQAYIDRMEGAQSEELGSLTFYVKGKFLYFKGDIEQARTVFERIPSSSPYYFQSRYFVGVTYAVKGEYEKALAIFQSITALKPSGVDPVEAREIQDLALLAIGRLYYEMGKATESAEAYQHVARNSEFFDTALFEVTWVLIKSGDFLQAIRMLEVLMVATPHSRYIPDAKLLMGNLLIRVGRYDEARVVFDEMVAQFSPAKNQLQDFVREKRNAKEYFRELISRNMETFTITSILPPMAMEWVSEEEEVTHALETLGDLNGCSRDIHEMERLLVKLETAVSGSSAIYVFVNLRDGEREAVLAANKAARFRSALLAAEEASIGAQSVPADLAQVERDRRSLEPRLQELPVSKEQIVAQDRADLGTLEDAHKELSRNEVQIERLEATLVAIEKYLQDTNNQGLSISVADEIRLQKLGIANSRKEVDKIKEGLDRLEIQSASGGVKSDDQQSLRKRVAEVARQERGLMDAKGYGLSGKVDPLLAKLDAIDSSVVGFRQGLEMEATRRIQDLKARIETEKTNLVQYRSTLESLKGEAEETIGGVVYRNFMTVKKRFYDLVLKADVGVIDVAWMTKEEHSTRIDQLTKDRSSEFKVLDNEFQEVLQQNGKQVMSAPAEEPPKE